MDRILVCLVFVAAVSCGGASEPVGVPENSLAGAAGASVADASRYGASGSGVAENALAGAAGAAQPGISSPPESSPECYCPTFGFAALCSVSVSESYRDSVMDAVHQGDSDRCAALVWTYSPSPGVYVYLPLCDVARLSSTDAMRAAACSSEDCGEANGVDLASLGALMREDGYLCE